MKVIITNSVVYPFHPYGGIEKRVYYLAKHLIEQGVEVEVVASLPEDGRKETVYESIPYTFLSPCVANWTVASGLSYPIRLMLFSLNLARYLRKQRFDILHAHLAVPYFYLHFSRRAPVVFQPFEEIYDLKMLLEKTENIFQKLRRQLILFVKRHEDRYCMTHAAAIASEGDFQSDIFVDLFGVDRERVFDLPVAVDPSLIADRLKSRKLSRQDLGLSNDDLVLISVNRIESNKGINYLIEAFRMIKKVAINAKLILVGTGSEEEEIQNQIRDYGLGDSVIRLKNASEALLYESYALSDIYVSPTLDVGSIQSVIESMACGLPVVSTGQDFWVKSGVNGFVVPKKDPEAMARTIVEVYESGKCKEYGEASRRIAGEYDYRVVTGKAIRKYQELLAK